MKYAVTIKWPHGPVTRVTVTKETLAGFRLRACKGCSVSIVKVRS